MNRFWDQVPYVILLIVYNQILAPIIWYQIALVCSTNNIIAPFFNMLYPLYNTYGTIFKWIAEPYLKECILSATACVEIFTISVVLKWASIVWNVFQQLKNLNLSADAAPVHKFYADVVDNVPFVLNILCLDHIVKIHSRYSHVFAVFLRNDNHL